MSDLWRFESGQRARDRESDDSPVLVLGAKGKTAEERETGQQGFDTFATPGGEQ